MFIFRARYGDSTEGIHWFIHDDSLLLENMVVRAFINTNSVGGSYSRTFIPHVIVVSDQFSGFSGSGELGGISLKSWTIVIC